MSNNDNKISTGGLSNLEFPQELLNRIGLTAQQLIDMSVTPDDLTPMPIEERRASDGADFLQPPLRKKPPPPSNSAFALPLC